MRILRCYCSPWFFLAVYCYAFNFAFVTSFSFPVHGPRSPSTKGAAVCPGGHDHPSPAMTTSFSASDSASTPPASASSSVAEEARALHLFRRTPLVHSASLSRKLGKPVYLKLDALQASGSYKDRGVAQLCMELKQKQGVTHVISSSGGNAGLAVATVGLQLGLSVHVIVPQTTKSLVITKLQNLGAQVTVHGENWNQADVLARQMVEDDTTKTVAYVPPYDHPLLWTGISTWIDEVVEDLVHEGVEPPIPSAVIVGVGGGGLLCGTLEGLDRHGLHRTTVIAAETEGAASFGTSLREGKLVRLDAIRSIATSLGALEVTPAALERTQQHIANGGAVRESLCTDAQAVSACLDFAKDHRLLVEPACGAVLAVLYSEPLRDQALLSDCQGPIVIEVCGGSGVDVTLLQHWKDQFLKE